MDDQQKRPMSKRGFAAELARRTGLEEKQAQEITNIFLDILTDQWSTRQPVSFLGFGTFETRTVSPGNSNLMRMGPGSTEYRPDFRPSRTLRETIAREVADPAQRELRPRTVLSEPIVVREKPRGRPRRDKPPEEG